MSRDVDSRGFHPWRLVRHDIGRKVTAIAMALLLWIYLAGLISANLEDHPQLGVYVMHGMNEALTESQGVPGVYLILPEDLIVRDDLSLRHVKLSGSGLAEELEGLRLSAFVELTADDLDGADERQIDVLLQNRDLFRARGKEPTLRDFRVSVRGGGARADGSQPGVLRLTLARRAEAEFLLTPANVTVEGSPREGYAFDQDAIRAHPNRVLVSGPSKAIASLRDDPTRLKLAPVDIEGRVFDVSQQVGIDVERVDRSVLLDTLGNVVEVTVPIRARDMDIDLVGVPVYYVGTAALAARGQSVVSADGSLDLRVTGPRSVLGGLSQEDLVKLIRLEVDWTDVLLPRSQELVHVFRQGLPAAPVVRITDRSGSPPRVEYHLEETPMDDSGNGSAVGDTP